MRSIVEVVRTFLLLRCSVEACNGNTGDFSNWRINKVIIIGTDLEFYELLPYEERV